MAYKYIMVSQMVLNTIKFSPSHCQDAATCGCLSSDPHECREDRNQPRPVRPPRRAGRRCGRHGMAALARIVRRAPVAGPAPVECYCDCHGFRR